MIGNKHGRRPFGLVTAVVLFLTLASFCAAQLTTDQIALARQQHQQVQQTWTDSSDGQPVESQKLKLSNPSLLDHFPSALVPTEKNGRRLILLGDIHGMKGSLDKLLAKAHFNEASDHIISCGDMINKGPDSPGVVERLMHLKASAVRGNHEDNVLNALADWEEAGTDKAKRRKAKKNKHLTTAKQLSSKQVQWLAQLPVILTIESLEIVVVHAGMVPGLQPVRQNPWAVMNMRTLLYKSKNVELRKRTEEDNDDEVDIDGGDDFYKDPKQAPTPSETRDGEQWAHAWNRRQDRQRKHTRRTIIYGHDAKRGLRRGKFTFGLDSACVKGEQLTALIIEGKKGGGYKHEFIQVDCDWND